MNTKFKTIIFILLLFGTFNVIKPNNSFVVRNYTKAEISYYETYPWDFLEDVFVKSSDKARERFTGISFVVSLIPIILPIEFMILSSMNGDDLIDGKKILKLFPVLVLLSMIIYLVSNHYLNKNVAKRLFYCFMVNYNPDLNSGLEYNFKKFVPLELVPTFDAMYNEYHFDNERFFRNRGLFVFVRVMQLAEKYSRNKRFKFVKTVSL